MIFYQLEFRQDSEQMLWSKSFDSRTDAIQAFHEAEFSGKCDVIELHQYEEDKPTFEGNLLESKTLKTKTFEVNWTDNDSIDFAEKQKITLENKGYTLKDTERIRFNKYKFTYTKTIHE